MRTTTPVFLCLLLVLAVVVRAGVVYPELPNRMAVHFDGTGDPDGWQSKQGFLALMAAVVVLIAWLPPLVSALLGRLPAGWWNLPNRNYWLAPERIEETRAVLCRYVAWISLATLLLMGWVLEATYHANLAPELRLSGAFTPVMFAYLGFVAVWSVVFLLRFARRP